MRIDPYYQDERATVYNMDALKVLAELPTGAVDAVITDPPYSSGGLLTSQMKSEVLSGSQNAFDLGGVR